MLNKIKPVKKMLEEVLGEKDGKQVDKFEIISLAVKRLGGAYVLIPLKGKDTVLEWVWSYALL